MRVRGVHADGGWWLPTPAQGFSMAMAGNAMLLSYFLEAGEAEAALVQAIGASSNFIMLSQARARPAVARVIAVGTVALLALTMDAISGLIMSRRVCSLCRILCSS